MALALAAALFLGELASAHAQFVATRVWPARDYTRVTFESRHVLDYTLFPLKDPERLVLDLGGDDAGGVLASLQEKVAAGDPYIAALRVAANRPGVTRVVLDLKAEVRPQLFALKPVADYGHRLVLDLYPMVPPDPLAALLELNGQIGTAPPQPQRPGSGKPSVARLATVVIDAGHGGEDPGARGRRGTLEKDITLLIARRLKALIDAEPGMRAVLTRDGDYYLALGDRVEKARKVKADLFISVHADAFIRPHARGSSVFTLSQRPTSDAARWLAKQENDSDLIGGVNLDTRDPYLKQVLVDLSQTATSDHSLKLAGAVLSELGQINTLHKPHVERAGFAVLKAPDVPSILVETAFISNPQEERRLQDEAYQDKMARAILAGIKRYFTRHPPRPQGPLALN
ncbi:MAG: N-acetylmuramoyl-L-alanine amidase [Betaproteobacteria bacterium]|nr:N-acetylmuramoyl-L-alanine amidase [Betaproteobacteria bacterium]